MFILDNYLEPGSLSAFRNSIMSPSGCFKLVSSYMLFGIIDESEDFRTGLFSNVADCLVLFLC